MGAFFAASSRSLLLYSPPPFSSTNKTKQARSFRARIIAKLNNNEERDKSLLLSALHSASIRFQESLRPDPLFLDPYAGCFLSPNTSHADPTEQSAMTTPAAIPYCYNLATKFIDDKLLSVMSSSDELRQIVLLTDGMDTRPYRLRWPRSSLIYDISPGKVFEEACQKLKGVGAKISKSCMMLHVPLESSDLRTGLCKKGFSGNKLSLWALQGLPLMAHGNLKDILLTISSLAMQGSICMGELPCSLLDIKFGDMSTPQDSLERLFMSHGFQFNMVDYNEVARSLQLDPPPGDYNKILFVARQLRLSDDQTEIWREHFGRLEEEGDEEGFEEL